ncbi:MAG: hypothetical protein JWP97_1094 [Labilithrix sp.]|nr:hypothetical protein [Labilithrix sp.]
MRRPRLDLLALAASLALLAYLFVVTTIAMSRVVDGTRYFWLDDDMMISMRYARNLAEGHGLVWNAGGEHVEGYTNFLWTIVMAGVHLAGASDAHAAVVVRAVSFALCAGSLVLTVRLLRVFVPRAPWAAPLALTGLVMCPDFVLWSVWGFETALLTFLGLLFFVRLMTRGLDGLALAALALIPLTRGDGLYLFGAHALVALLVLPRARWRRTVLCCAAALVPALAHLVFRRVYYGDWLPNTYYLKVHQVDHLRARGWLYARAFLVDHAVLLALACGAAIAVLRTDRRASVVLVMTGSVLAYVVNTGGDMFNWFRFFAHVMPLLFVFATVGAVRVARGRVAGLTWAVVLLFVSVPLVSPLRRLLGPDTNGDPEKQLRVAIAVKKNALPTSTVAVFCAGVVPYFARLPAVDLLGKSDRTIARMRPYPGAMIGHGKVDPEHTLALDPDLVVTCNTGVTAALAATPGATSIDPMVAILGSPSFRSRYLPYPVTDPFLVQQTAIYTHSGSPEEPRRHWPPASPALP